MNGTWNEYRQYIDRKEWYHHLAMTNGTYKHIILITVNKKYLQHLQIWYSHFKIQMMKYSLFNYSYYKLFIVTFDRDSYIHLTQNLLDDDIKIIDALNFSFCAIPDDKKNDNYFNQATKIYIFRGCYIKYLLSLNYVKSITMTDIDAIWYKNPFIFLLDKRNINNFDILVSSGHNQNAGPVFNEQLNVKRKWKYKKNKRKEWIQIEEPWHMNGVCMGFIHFNNNNNTKLFYNLYWKYIQTKVGFIGSDQHHFNLFINQYSIHKEIIYNDILNMDNLKSRIRYQNESNEISIGIIPQSIVSRDCHYATIYDIYILHCHLMSDYNHGIKNMLQFNLTQFFETAQLPQYKHQPLTTVPIQYYDHLQSK